MRLVFLDTHFLVARFHVKDQWHQRAIELDHLLRPYQGITTDAVLIEFANYFSGYGPDARRTVVRTLYRILQDPLTEVLLVDTQLLMAGLALYLARLDKRYSLTDCISMSVMRQRGITDILTHDRHFAQEGFHVLI